MSGGCSKLAAGVKKHHFNTSLNMNRDSPDLSLDLSSSNQRPAASSGKAPPMFKRLLERRVTAAARAPPLHTFELVFEHPPPWTNRARVAFGASLRGHGATHNSLANKLPLPATKGLMTLGLKNEYGFIFKDFSFA